MSGAWSSYFWDEPGIDHTRFKNNYLNDIQLMQSEMNGRRSNSFISHLGIYLSFLYLFFFSCTSGEEATSLSKKDTADIVNAALNSKTFLKDNIRTDTIYLLKSKHYNKSWPSKTSYFKLNYIDDTKDLHSINIPGKAVDKRTRVATLQFTLKKDTISLSLFDYGVQTNYDFKLKKQDGVWKTIYENYSLVNAMQ